MPRLLGLIFDLDGTLVDSAPDQRQALNAMLREHGRREITLTEAKAMTGDGMLTLVTRAFEVTGGMPAGADTYALFQAFITHYRALPPDPVQLYPQARETLQNYVAAGVKLGLCTNMQETASARLLEQLGLKRFFSFIAGGDTFPVHKPHPGHVSGVMSALKVFKGQCAMIGDTFRDVRAAHGAGIPCIVTAHGQQIDVEKTGADGIIQELGELPAALTALGFSSEDRR